MRSRHARPSRRPSFTFAVALAVAALLVASGSAPCWAVLNDNTVKGAATHHVFSSSFGDSIDTLSGQLHFKIPIGPSFAVSDSFSYQLYLTYTSKVWRYDAGFFTGTNDPNDPVARYRLDGRAQAGVGFYLQMGRIFWKGEGGEWHLIVQLADGTEHDVTNGVADDLSYIRADRLEQDGRVWYLVKTSDGVWYTMDHWVGDPGYDPNIPPDSGNPNARPSEAVSIDGYWHDPQTNDVRGWYVTKIEQVGPTGSLLPLVTVTYGSTPRVDDHLMTSVTDRRGRNTVFTNAPCDDAAGLGCPPGQSAPSGRWLPSAYVTEVRLPAFGANGNETDAAVYKFFYEQTTTTDDLVRVPSPAEVMHTLSGEVFLKRIVDPAGHATSFDYIDPLREDHHVGVITTRTLPTGATIEYDYARYSFGMSWSPGQPCGNYSPGRPASGYSYWDQSWQNVGGTCSSASGASLPATTGVVRKRVKLNPGLSSVFDPSAPVEVHEWEWNRNFVNDPGSGAALSNPYKVIETDPFGNWIVHYFASSAGGDPNNDFYDDAHWDDGLSVGTEYFLGPGLMLLRGVYREYEDDSIPTWDENHPEYERHGYTNRRVKATTTADYEAGAQYRRLEEKEWDSCGHYRLREEYGLDGSLYRSRRTCYNCPSDPNASPPQSYSGFCVLPDPNTLGAN